jgi:hypothetical protein
VGPSITAISMARLTWSSPKYIWYVSSQSIDLFANFYLKNFEMILSYFISK